MAHLWAPETLSQQVWVGCGQLRNNENLVWGPGPPFGPHHLKPHRPRRPPPCSRTLEATIIGERQWHGCQWGAGSP